MMLRNIQDVLREEYLSLLPHIRRCAEELEAEVRHALIPIVRHLANHERIVIKCRVKECESAIATLQRRRHWNRTDPATYPSLTSLNDLAGLRILAFPKRLVLEIDDALRVRFADWVPDPVPPIPGSANSLALKYHGLCSQHYETRAEIQIMSMLVGMFWEVEHATLYKPGPELRGVERSLTLQTRYADVIRSLEAFESEIEVETGDRPRRLEELVN